MRLEEVKETRRVLLFPNYPACILSMASRDWAVWICTHFVQLHEPLSQPIHFITVDCCDAISVLDPKQDLPPKISQFEPCMMLSSI